MPLSLNSKETTCVRSMPPSQKPVEPACPGPPEALIVNVVPTFIGRPPGPTGQRQPFITPKTSRRENEMLVIPLRGHAVRVMHRLVKSGSSGRIRSHAEMISPSSAGSPQAIRRPGWGSTSPSGVTSSSRR